MELLVFQQRGRTAARLQVPSGQMRFGEREEEALYRIIEDLTGLVHLRFVGKIDAFLAYGGSLRNSKEIHAYHVSSLESPPGRWAYLAELEEGQAQMLDFFWMDIDQAARFLDEEQAQGLPLLREPRSIG
ncbi:MAG: hypothetical protein OHK0039_03080 [Bacteroidia bacterium]